MLKVIRVRCGVLSIGSEPERDGSHAWRRESMPFTLVLRTLRRRGLSFMKAVALSEPGGEPLAASPWHLLSAAMASRRGEPAA